MEATASLPSGTVTFLFTDIEGSTQLWEQYPEAMKGALARHDALLRAAIEAQNGSVFKTVGDAFCAAFVAAPEAVAAAVEAQRAIAAEAWGEVGRLRARMALNTGAAEERGGDYFGPPLNRLARLLAAGHGGQILLSQATSDLVREALPPGTSLRDLGSHRLKDLQQPEHLYQLLHPNLPADFAPLRSLEAFAHNLPAQLTSFIGREEAMAAVKQLLTTTRLLTLTGSGGCGKTRLALQVAEDLLETHPDGVWLVELAALADPTLVPQTVAAALGVREQPGRPLIDTLCDYLRPKQVLLVLDNCEHLLPACAQLADALLRRCPHLRVLATSREGLDIAGERTYRVPSLSLPDARHLPPVERLMEYEAVHLFVERAVYSQPSFAVTGQNALAVAQVCQRLDGIPLAIELAAARVKALPVEKLNERLDDMFRLLTGGSRIALPRHQTLQALIDWSYHLLSESEQTLLRRLSVFAGGWVLEAAEAVCAEDGVEEWQVLDLLTELVEKSLVLYDPPEGTGGAEGASTLPSGGTRGPDPGRYRLLETVRQYARDRLLEEGNAAAARDRHRGWFVALAERAEPHLCRGAKQRVWMERLEREHDNLRAALEWCVKAVDSGQWLVDSATGQGPKTELSLSALTTNHQPLSTAVEGGLRAAGALTWFWIKRGYLEEGWQYVIRLLAAGGSASVGARRKALAGAMMVAGYRNDPSAQAALAAEGLALGREAGDPWLTAISLRHSAAVAKEGNDLERAQVLCEEALALARTADDGWLITVLLQSLGYVAEARGDDGLARTLHQEALDRFREAEDTGGIAAQHSNLGRLAQREGSYEESGAHYREAVALFREGGETLGVLRHLPYLADLALLQGDYEAAVAHYDEVLALAREQEDESRMADALLGLARVAQAAGDPQAVSGAE